MVEHVWPLPEVEYRPFSTIEDERDVAVVYSRAAYEAVADDLRQLRMVSAVEPREATVAHWDGLLADLRGEVIYAIGGGLAVDAAKYMAMQRALPLVSLPTAVSVDAFLTWASGIRRDGGVYYIPTKPPELVIADLNVLAAAPAAIRAAGMCDVLSIATGSFDWRWAEERDKNPAEMAFIPYVYETAQAILQGALDCAEAAGAGDHQGVKQLIDCLALEVQLCNQIGHSRPEEGSEHYFAYAVENLMGKGLPHGDLVGPGIMLMAAAQGQETETLRRALLACHANLQAIPDAAVEQTLRKLPAYCVQHTLPYGIAHELGGMSLDFAAVLG